jgi:hypothetical protein
MYMLIQSFRCYSISFDQNQLWILNVKAVFRVSAKEFQLASKRNFGFEKFVVTCSRMW